MSTSLTNALWMRPYDEIDTSVPDLGVDVLPGRLAALSHPLNKGREILYADRETRDPDVCTVTSSGIRGFEPGEVAVLVPSHGIYLPQKDERELRIVGVAVPWWESVLGKWSEEGFAPAPGLILVERERPHELLKYLIDRGALSGCSMGKTIILPDSLRGFGTVGKVLADNTDQDSSEGERICFEQYEYFTFKECLPESGCVVKAGNESKGWLRSLNDPQ